MNIYSEASMLKTAGKESNWNRCNSLNQTNLENKRPDYNYIIYIKSTEKEFQTEYIQSSKYAARLKSSGYPYLK
jgi:hypothetical protein